MTQMWMWMAKIMLPTGIAPATVIAPDQWSARKLLEAQYGVGKILGDYVECVKEVG